MLLLPMTLVATVAVAEMLLLFPVNKQHSSGLKLNKYKVIKSRENLKTVLTVHVQKCRPGFQSCHMCRGLVTGLCCVVIKSWLCLSDIFTSLGGQCKCSFCGLVRSAFCMLFHVRGCQGAEDDVGTQDPQGTFDPENPVIWKE